MRDLLKNRILHYLVVPAALAIWPLLVYAVYLPRLEESWKDEAEQFKKGRNVMEQILNLDPERLSGAKAGPGQFDFATVIQNVATAVGIRPADYKLTVKPVRKNKTGQKIQNAHVILRQVSIKSLAEFLDTLQIRYASLQCDQIKLTRVKGLPDAWKVDLDFAYYY